MPGDGLSPYANFTYGIFFLGRQVAGVSEMSPLSRATEALPFRAGDSPNQSCLSPGVSSFEPLTLSRGYSADLEFEQWATLVWRFNGGDGAEMGLANLRKDLAIELLDASGAPLARYFIYRSWVSQLVALPQWTGGAVGLALQSVRLEYEGWQRDASLVPPTATVTTTTTAARDAVVHPVPTVSPT